MSDDFIVTVHALERFEERFEDDYKSADDAGMLIYEEAMDALANNRVSHVAPVEFANNDLDRWQVRNSQIVWTPGKDRGYVLVEATEGLTVATVLVGRPSADARQRLYGNKQKSKPLIERDAYGFRVHETADAETGVETTPVENDP